MKQIHILAVMGVLCSMFIPSAIAENTHTPYALNNPDYYTIPVSNIFSDTSNHNEYAEAIAYMKDQGIITGYPDGSFHPGYSINRAEFLKIIVGAKYSASKINSCISSTYPSHYTYIRFPDVSKDTWFAPYICTALKYQIIDGYPDGTFKPEAYINFVEAAKILTSTLIPTDKQIATNLSSNPWYSSYISLLGEKKAIPRTISKLNSNVLRSDMAEMVYRLSTDTPSYNARNAYEFLNPDSLIFSQSTPIGTEIGQWKLTSVTPASHTDAYTTYRFIAPNGLLLNGGFINQFVAGKYQVCFPPTPGDEGLLPHFSNYTFDYKNDQQLHNICFSNPTYGREMQLKNSDFGFLTTLLLRNMTVRMPLDNSLPQAYIELSGEPGTSFGNDTTGSLPVNNTEPMLGGKKLSDLQVGTIISSQDGTEQFKINSIFGDKNASLLTLGTESTTIRLEGTFSLMEDSINLPCLKLESSSQKKLAMTTTMADIICLTGYDNQELESLKKFNSDKVRIDANLLTLNLSPIESKWWILSYRSITTSPE